MSTAWCHWLESFSVKDSDTIIEMYHQPSRQRRRRCLILKPNAARCPQQRHCPPSLSRCPPPSSSSSPPSETPCPSSPTQRPLAVTDPIVTPNPFAPLVGDTGDDDAPSDVQRASNTTSSACSSSAALASSADTDVGAKMTDRVVAAPAKPAKIVAQPTANKRPCTRASTATTLTHGFFRRLASRPVAVRTHFEKHYLPNSRMCPCDLFPVYVSKVDGVPKLPPELNAFCLQCISATVLSLGGPVVRALSDWAPGFATEMQTYYLLFYEEKEKKDWEKQKSARADVEKEIEKEDRERRWMCLLERMGFAGR